MIFSIAIIIFQMSCNKTVDAQSTTSGSVLNTTLVSKHVKIQTGTKTTVDSLGNTHTTPIYRFIPEFYVLDNKSLSLAKINLTMPHGIYPQFGNAVLTPDGNKIIFTATTSIDYQHAIYSASTDGTNLTKLVEGYALHGTY